MAQTTRKRSSTTSSKRASSSKRGGGGSQQRGSSSKRSNSRGSNGASSQEETDRYRRAAEDALQQLDWAIGYLHGIRKTEISTALAKNRSFIRKHLMGEHDEPLPNQQTDET